MFSTFQGQKTRMLMLIAISIADEMKGAQKNVSVCHVNR
jgi:hypothetical protein